MIAFPLPAAAAELPAGVQQILQQSELTPDKLVHITLQELLQTLAGWLKNAWGQPLQLARRAVLFLLLSSCVGLLADGDGDIWVYVKYNDKSGWVMKELLSGTE